MLRMHKIIPNLHSPRIGEVLEAPCRQAGVNGDQYEILVVGRDRYGKKPEDVFELLPDRCGLRISLLAGYLLKKLPLVLEGFCDQFYKGKNYYLIAYDIDGKSDKLLQGVDRRQDL